MSNSLASVPAWAPLGQDPLWYRHHLGEIESSDTAPLVEVLAHHRDRWEHLGGYDDFAQLTTCPADAPESWAQLADDSAMALCVSTAKHHDGWCWWDAPATDRTLTAAGPRRNILAEHAAACERHRLAFGAVYSMFDWGDPDAGSDEHVTRVVAPQLNHLIDHERPQLLWLRGPVTPADSERLVHTITSHDPEITVLSDAPVAAATRVRSTLPDDVDAAPWLMCRGVGLAPGYNRAEPSQHLLTTHEVISLYTEVLAKGGALLFTVGTDASGEVPESHAAPLREAGEWIRLHAPLLDTCQPWTRWGDETTRLLVDPSDDARLVAIDLDGAGRFRDLTPDRVTVRNAHPVGVTSVPDGPPRITQDSDGLHLDLGPRPSTQPVVWRLTVSEPERPVELFPPTTSESIDISDLLADAAPGDIVQLGDGTHRGRVVVPDRVTLRGLGPDRTLIHVDTVALELGRGSRIEHLTVSQADESAFDSSPTLIALVGESSRVLGCTVKGTIEVRADGAAIRACQLRGVRTKGADRLSLTHNSLVGRPGDIAVHLLGGGEHLIDSCEIRGHDGGVHAADTTGTTVRGSNMATTQFGVLLSHTENAHVHGNQIRRATRAVDVDAGTQARIEGNAVFDGDSGCVVQRGAADTHVRGNHWERCRVGLLAWGATALEEQDNSTVDLTDPAGVSVAGP